MICEHCKKDVVTYGTYGFFQEPLFHNFCAECGDKLFTILSLSREKIIEDFIACSKSEEMGEV